VIAATGHDVVRRADRAAEEAPTPRADGPHEATKRADLLSHVASSAEARAEVWSEAGEGSAGRSKSVGESMRDHDN
jgi:hypothetical protein